MNMNDEHKSLYSKHLDLQDGLFGKKRKRNVVAIEKHNIYEEKCVVTNKKWNRILPSYKMKLPI